MANAPSPFFSWGQALVKERGEIRLNWRDAAFLAFLGIGGGGQVFNGLGQGKVADELRDLKVAVAGLVTLKKDFDEYKATNEREKDEMRRWLKDLDLTLRQETFPSRQRP